MSDPNEAVRVASGPMVEMELLKQDLVDAGIDARVLGEALGASFGTAILGSVEIWVHQKDEAQAKAVIADTEKHARRKERQAHGHPASDPDPKRPGGHGPHTHYNADPRG
jgi:hypothetical protein